MKSTVNNSEIKRGMLTSAYKEDVKFSLKHVKTDAIFNLREVARENCENMTCSVVIGLKVALVAFVLFAIFY